LLIRIRDPNPVSGSTIRKNAGSGSVSGSALNHKSMRIRNPGRLGLQIEKYVEKRLGIKSEIIECLKEVKAV
jgi:hypothetical protein